VVGAAGLYSFNYMLPAGVRGAAITRTAGRYFERLVSHDATFRVLQHLRVTTFSKLLPLLLPACHVFARVSYLIAWLQMSTRLTTCICASSLLWSAHSL
jgi:ABC-type transport system involved in cytochrome bd biosynthesis fused ATPase/permease subunit